MVAKGVDFTVTARLREPLQRHGFTRPCGSRGAGLRWYVAGTAPSREAEAAERLAANGFGAFLPLVAREVRHARQTRTVTRPMFPGYVFAALDTSAPGWRRAAHTRHVRRIFGSDPETPTPLPAGVVERWMAAGFDRPVMQDIAPDLIAAGAEVAIAAGPFADHRGICLWDDGTRCRVLLSLLGRQVAATVPRRQVVAQ